jgi:hypothetical protein
MGIPVSEIVQSRVGMFRIQKGLHELHDLNAFAEEESKCTPWKFHVGGTLPSTFSGISCKSGIFAKHLSDDLSTD